MHAPPSPTGPIDAAVVIGRFAPPHLGHVALLRHAAALAPRVVAVVGSAFQARTPRTPWTWDERAAMVAQALGASCACVPVRDHLDETRWRAAIRQGVADAVPGARHVRLVGHDAGPHTAYLHEFAAWPLEALAAVPGVGADAVRDLLFRDRAPADSAALAAQLAPETLQAVRAWQGSAEHARLAGEWRALHDYHAAWRGTPWPPVFVTVDALVRCAGHVLLIERGQPPGRGLLATPGGFLEMDERLEQSCLRELFEETGLEVPVPALRAALREVAVLDRPQRSQRGRTLTHAHFFDLPGRELPSIRAGDDAAAARWIPVAALPSLEERFHDDHFQLLDHFLGLTPAP